MNDIPDVYDHATKLMDKENISRIHTFDLSGEIGPDESSSPSDVVVESSPPNFDTTSSSADDTLTWLRQNHTLKYMDKVRTEKDCKRGRNSELQVPFNKDSQDDHVLPWLEKMRRTRDVVFPCLREMKDIALKKRQKRWNDSKKIVKFEVGDIVNIMAHNSDTTVLTAKYIGSFIISVADKKSGTYEVNYVAGSSALNVGSD
ncbi:hypothetical protein SARC_06523 [Sphaeroforma arctica JP610]|uniref:Uncharacterized protein n=1 Tax=Sphaeroforma arctica JP610 TaxID=667725 RepID=A0A0L0FX76_9EUKA|nr:hypothetical protein SARC_06523 [Sphaeroforma arctica JP610]KNC81141.1 hypothetical protein SARC_06523 [Sphaeroforma arctica JP610]|eukprot:XP_014155043.1 hypothetical protein SARC_06523 [Sphaeroforma arctica JP610]